MLGDALIPEINELSKQRMDLFELERSREAANTIFEQLFGKFLITRYGHESKNHTSHRERTTRFLESNAEISRISLGVHFADQK